MMDASDILGALAPIRAESERFLALVAACEQLDGLENEDDGDALDVLLGAVLRSVAALASYATAATQRPSEPEDTDAGSKRPRRRHVG